MAHRHVVMASAWLEIIVGIAFITAPDVLCVLLFDEKPEGIAMPLARWLGVGLLGLGIASLPSEDWGIAPQCGWGGFWSLMQGWRSWSLGWA